ncbi:hypothetical protein AB0395_21745 [Streptosporangium sp. NPDC051023]|uniref:hypothetical protein n=1 Tax=Streptosporangium sp. NPDC051023 TaxID=3155410 RepID=UPI0034501B1F
MVVTVWEWVTVDFQTGHPGWRALCLGAGEVRIVVVAGWLMQEEMAYAESTGRRIADPDRLPYRRVVAAVTADDAALVEAFTVEGFWRLLAPGEKVPGSAEVNAEVRRRASMR